MFSIIIPHLAGIEQQRGVSPSRIVFGTTLDRTGIREALRLEHGQALAALSVQYLLTFSGFAPPLVALLILLP